MNLTDKIPRKMPRTEYCFSDVIKITPLIVYNINHKISLSLLLKDSAEQIHRRKQIKTNGSE